MISYDPPWAHYGCKKDLEDSRPVSAATVRRRQQRALASAGNALLTRDLIVKAENESYAQDSPCMRRWVRQVAPRDLEARNVFAFDGDGK